MNHQELTEYYRTLVECHSELCWLFEKKHFIVDFENVKNNGLKGSDCLLISDSVELFFSDACPTIANGIFEHLKKSECEVRVCKLQILRKNALDFYITSRLGELIGSGYQEQIAIISNDKDYKSVQEYWRECSDTKRRILLSGTEYASQLAEIEKVYEKRNDKKVLYLNSLKRFGRKNGLQIYNQMKQIIV